MAAEAVRATPDGIDLRIRLTPRAARDALGPRQTLSDGSEVVTAHVRAVPSDGAANAALVALVARGFDVARSSVEIVAGHTARIKTVRIRGPAATLAATLARLTGDA